MSDAKALQLYEILFEHCPLFLLWLCSYMLTDPQGNKQSQILRSLSDNQLNHLRWNVGLRNCDKGIK